MWVKIIKCSFPESWYAKLVGETFEVYKEDGEFYLVEDEDMKYGFQRFINNEDCEWCE